MSGWASIAGQTTRAFARRAALLTALWSAVALWGVPPSAALVVAATGSGATQRALRQATPDPSDAGLYDLAVDESLGGHTLARHVGRTDAQLAERLRAEPDISAKRSWRA